MFENKIIKGVHASRYIASWLKSGGDMSKELGGRFDFEEWLESLGLSNDDVSCVLNLAVNGRMELETSARKFIKKLHD